jgi:hypothetical protein
LSVGKSIKIIRYLEDNQKVVKKKKINIEQMENKIANKAPSLDHQGLNYESLSRQFVTIKQYGGANYSNSNGDKPSFEIEAIASNITESTTMSSD